MRELDQPRESAGKSHLRDHLRVLPNTKRLTAHFHCPHASSVGPMDHVTLTLVLLAAANIRYLDTRS